VYRSIALAAALSLSCTTIPPSSADGGEGCTCAGRECGTDGCGNSCGTCPGGTTCDASGRCVTECVPDCRDRECGPDPVCGMSCGPTSCDDGNPCTTETCDDGTCLYGDVDGEYACVNELAVSACSGGTSTDQTCGRRAREISGTNATFGCASGQCRTTSFTDRPTCTEDETACATADGLTYIGLCLRDETGATYWYFKTCSAVCTEDERYTAWTGECGENDEGREVCFCR